MVRPRKVYTRFVQRTAGSAVLQRTLHLDDVQHGRCWAMLQDNALRLEPGKECGGIVRANLPLTPSEQACVSRVWGSLPFKASSFSLLAKRQFHWQILDLNFHLRITPASFLPPSSFLLPPSSFLLPPSSFLLPLTALLVRLNPCLHNIQSLPARPSSRSLQTRLFNMAQLG